MLIVVIMTERLNRLSKELLEAHVANLRTLSKEARLHYTTLTRWRLGEVEVSPESAAKLARVIRERALESLDLASRLEAEAQAEMEDR